MLPRNIHKREKERESERERKRGGERKRYGLSEQGNGKYRMPKIRFLHELALIKFVVTQFGKYSLQYYGLLIFA